VPSLSVLGGAWWVVGLCANLVGLSVSLSLSVYLSIYIWAKVYIAPYPYIGGRVAPIERKGKGETLRG